MTQPVEQRPEPYRLPRWVTPLAAVLMAVGIVKGFPLLTLAATALAIWWLALHLRWTAWDVDRMAKERTNGQ